MNKFFNSDSPVMRFLSRMADVFWINLLTFVCSIPIITIGASVTAMHYILLKMVRNEEGYITKSYFKSFKENFKQATGMWLIFLVLFGALAFDLYAVRQLGASFPKAMVIAIYVALFVISGIYLWAFPLLARFENTIRGTLRNAVILTVASFPRTLGMLGLSVLPVLVFYFGGTPLVPFVAMFGIAGPAYGCAALYSKAFRKFEPKEEPVSLDDDTLDDVPDSAYDTFVRDLNEVTGDETEKPAEEQAGPSAHVEEADHPDKTAGRAEETGDTAAENKPAETSEP